MLCKTKNKNRTDKRKKAISLMLSYVLLIVMTISLAVIIYSWLTLSANIEPIPKCPEGTAIVIQDYNCIEVGKKIELTLKNNGRFNIEGFYIKGTENKDETATKPLEFISGGGSGDPGGFYLFEGSFAPNDVQTVVFSYAGIDILKKISIEPFRLHKDEVILCANTVTTHELNC